MLNVLLLDRAVSIVRRSGGQVSGAGLGLGPGSALLAWPWPRAACGVHRGVCMAALLLRGGWVTDLPPEQRAGSPPASCAFLIPEGYTRVWLKPFGVVVSRGERLPQPTAICNPSRTASTRTAVTPSPLATCCYTCLLAACYLRKRAGATCYLRKRAGARTRRTTAALYTAASMAQAAAFATRPPPPIRSRPTPDSDGGRG
jgi:hypothetical protein